MTPADTINRWLHEIRAMWNQPWNTTNTNQNLTPITGTRQPPDPININHHDLAAPNRPQTLTTPQTPDQTGHISAQTTLAYWTNQWATQLNQPPPPDNIHDQTNWLTNHHQWAAHNTPYYSEFLADIRHIHQTLTRYTTTTDQTPAGPCPNTHHGHQCGTQLHVTPWQNEIQCPTCHTRYPRHTWLQLAQRNP